MATVKLGDIIDVDIYEAIAPENDPENTDFFTSGVVVRSDELDRRAQLEAELINMPFWRDLDNSIEPNYSDDSDNSSSPNKIVQGEMAAKRASLNQSWAARDLTNEMTMGDDAMTRIKARTSNYWLKAWQNRLVAASIGVFNANVAGNILSGFGTAGDMVVDISTNDTVATPITDVHLFDAEAFIDATFTMGDAEDELGVLAVHSTVKKRMKKENLIDYIVDSEAKRTIEMYQGYRVVTSDQCPVVPVGNGTGNRYLNMIFGPGAFGYGEGTPTTPVEVDRNPAIGSGGGEETLYERKTWLLHPFGHNNENAANNGGGGLWQNLTDLQNAANWERRLYRKNVPLAYLITNG